MEIISTFAKVVPICSKTDGRLCVPLGGEGGSVKKQILKKIYCKNYLIQRENWKQYFGPKLFQTERTQRLACLPSFNAHVLTPNMKSPKQIETAVKKDP